MPRVLPFRKDMRKERVRNSHVDVVNDAPVGQQEDDFNEAPMGQQEDSKNEPEEMSEDGEEPLSNSLVLLSEEEPQPNALAIVDPQVVPPLNVIAPGKQSPLRLLGSEQPLGPIGAFDETKVAEMKEEHAYTTILSDVGLDLNVPIAMFLQEIKAKVKAAKKEKDQQRKENFKKNGATSVEITESSRKGKQKAAKARLRTSSRIAERRFHGGHFQEGNPVRIEIED
ncbi:hypothetical protein AMTR_s00077p00187180, partial [Amborella trichopoda]